MTAPEWNRKQGGLEIAVFNHPDFGRSATISKAKQITVDGKKRYDYDNKQVVQYLSEAQLKFFVMEGFFALIVMAFGTGTPQPPGLSDALTKLAGELAGSTPAEAKMIIQDPEVYLNLFERGLVRLNDKTGKLEKT